MNTKKEKQNQRALRRPVLLEAQDFLSKEIDEVINMLDPISLDDFPFKVKPPVMFEPSEKELAWTQIKEKKNGVHFSCRWNIDDINGSPVVQDLSEKQALDNSHLIHLDVDKTKPQLDYKQDIFVFAD